MKKMQPGGNMKLLILEMCLNYTSNPCWCITTSTGDQIQESKFIGKASDMNSNNILQYDRNPILNTCIYSVVFPYELIDKYSANLVTDNL